MNSRPTYMMTKGTSYDWFVPMPVCKNCQQRVYWGLKSWMHDGGVGSCLLWVEGLDRHTGAQVDERLYDGVLE